MATSQAGLSRLLLVSPSGAGPIAGTSTSTDVGTNSDVMLILAALLCTLICLVGLAFMARCAWQCRFLRGAAAGDDRDDGELAWSNKGLKKKAIAALPVAPFSVSAGKSAECAICLTDFLAGEPVRLLPHCAHCFHPSCIDTWLSSHSSCPSCRLLLHKRPPSPPATPSASIPASSSRCCERCGLTENSPPALDRDSGNDSGDVGVVAEQEGKLGEDDPNRFSS